MSFWNCPPGLRAAGLMLLILLAALWRPDRVAAQPGVEDFSDGKDSLAFELRHEQTVRSSGPIPLEIDLTWRGRAILKGQLVVEVRDAQGYSRYSTGRTPLIALNPGPTRIRMLLPTVDGQDATGNVEIYAKFVVENGKAIDLQSRPLRIPSMADRRFRVLFCDAAGGRIGDGATDLLKSLAFERFWKAASVTGRSLEDRPDKVETVPTITSGEDMPQDAAWLCGFNMVVVRQAGLDRMRPRQLEALRDWVHAGGALLVEAAAIADPQLIEWLNEVVAPGRPARFVNGTDNRMEKPAGVVFEQFEAELGRAAVLFRDFAEVSTASTPEWNALVAWLWFFRRDQVEAVRSSGRFQWITPAELTLSQDAKNAHQASMNNQYYNNYYGQERPDMADTLMTRELRTGTNLLARLMPDDVQIMPLEYIAAILVLYVLTIGPLDWFLLGALKLRRLTWITFPAATVAFTLFTIWLSHRFLDSDTERSAVTVVDMAGSGRPLRTNRIELLFNMTSHEVKTEVTAGLFTPLDHTRFGSSDPYNYGQRQSTAEATPPVVTGRPPAAFEVSQVVPKWSPHLNRVFQLAPPVEKLRPEAAKFDWKREWNLPDGEAAARSELTAAVQSAFGPQAVAVIYKARSMEVLHGTLNQAFDSMQESRWTVDPTSGSQTQEVVYQNFLTDITTLLQGGGLFGVVHRLAPHGGDNFEDLSLVDPSDPDQWALVVAVTEGEDTWIYRRVYRNPPAAAQAASP